ncbi:MAG: hypothetical protein PVF58_12685 [Candidatus Methanofastidiosia archaeon]|jgi:hypothetical protein
MKKLMIRLTPEQEAGIREAFGFGPDRECKVLQLELDDREIDAIRSDSPSRPVPPYLYVPPPAEMTAEGPVALF